MARKNELQEWKDRLNVSHNKFKIVEPKIDRAWNYYRGKQWDTSSWTMDGYRDKPVDNVVFANLRAIIPRLNFKNPKIYVTPKKKPFRIEDGMFDTLAASASVEVVLNYYYKMLQIKREARKCLYDALLSPKGIMEIGYTLKTEKIVDGEKSDVNELIQEDSPYCMRVDPKDFRSDPEGTDALLNDSRWIARRWVKALDDIKKDDKLSNTANLKCNYRVKTDFNKTTMSRENFPETEDPYLWGRVEGWTIYDKKTMRVMDLVEGHDKFLRNEEDWPIDYSGIGNGFPVEILYFNENSGDNEPIPDVWQYLDMQDELNRISSMNLDHIRRISQRRYIMREGSMESEEILKLTHGGDGTIAQSKMNPQETIMPLQDATISQDIYMIRQGLKQTIREMAGVSGAEAMATQKFEQATEPALIEQASKTLRGDQQSLFEGFLVRIVEKLSKTIQETSDEISIPLDAEQMTDKALISFIQNKMVKITGEEGAVQLQPWLDLKKNDLKGEYLYDIEVGSTLPANEEQRKQDAVTLYQLMQNNLYVKPREGTKAVFDAFKQPDPDKLLFTDEEVMQTSMANMKAQMEREIAVDRPKRETDLAKTQIKSQTTKEVTAMKNQAAAQSLEAEHGKNVLDMVHSQQKHELEMGHEKEKQDLSTRGAILDMIKQAKMGAIEIDKAEKMKLINLTTALKKGDDTD